jgi:DUF4097 and DUF4098 domain-containing protein YvlB
MKLAIALFASLACAGCTMHIDKSITVEKGDRSLGRHTVEGNVRLDDGASGQGLSSVDGDVRLGQHATAKSARSVDGNISVGEYATVEGVVETVTGTISAASGARIGPTSTVSGNIDLDSAVVKGGLQTTSGSIRLRGNTTVEGGITLVAPKASDTDDVKRLPTVLIGPGVRVLGPIHAARGGSVVASRDAVLGPVEGLTVRRVDGDPNL